MSMQTAILCAALAGANAFYWTPMPRHEMVWYDTYSYSERETEVRAQPRAHTHAPDATRLTGCHTPPLRSLAGCRIPTPT